MSPLSPTDQPPRPRWMVLCLRAAAVYNLAWSLLIVLWPGAIFDLAGMRGVAPATLALWQGSGMFVGVFGVGYWLASRDPLGRWPLVLVGAMSKLLGALGSIWTVLQGALPAEFAIIAVPNEVLWLPPLGVILWRARAHARRGAEG